MRAKQPLFVIPFTLLLCVVLLGTEAPARVSGQLVEPDVLLVIDTSGSMDWLPNTPTDVNEWNFAQEQCLEDDPSNERSSWQTLQDAFLGTIPSAKYHCSVEPPAARPSLHGGVDKEEPDWYVPENTAEFRQSPPHTRSVSCPDGMWQPGVNGFGQCIADITNNYLSGTAKCYNDDNDTTNDPTGKGAGSDLYLDYCFNLNPESDPRQPNGILQGYSSDVRFGIMTFDNVPNAPRTASSPCGVTNNVLQPNTDWKNRWDYGASRHWKCGEYADNLSLDLGVEPDDECECWNAGARESSDGTMDHIFGGMVRFGDPMVTNPSVQGALKSMEPNLCSPLGAIIDDVGYFFANDTTALPASADAPGSGTKDFRGADVYYRCRPKIVVLITDGQPTPAFEYAAGSCGTEDHWEPWRSDSDPQDRLTPSDPDSDRYLFNCPWRSSPEEAGELFALGTEILANLGSDATTGDQPIYLVVIGFNVPDVADCSATPEECIPYTAAYNDRRCYIPECTGTLPDGTVVNTGTDVQCLMTPREFLNEVACKGWPWDPPAQDQEYNTAVDPMEPPWIDKICGTTDDDICNADDEGRAERALFVGNDASELASVIGLVLGSFNSEIATRTDVVTWNVPRTTGAAADDIASQYEYRSGYIAKDDGLWEGVLTSKAWSCGTATACETGTDLQKSVDSSGNIKNIGTLLKTQSVRKLLSFRPDNQAGTLDSTDYAAIPPTEPEKYATMGCTNPASGCTWALKPIDDNSAFDDCDFGVGNQFSTGCVGTHKVQDEVAGYLQDRGLADIYSSNPAILGPPVERLSIPSYQAFRAPIIGDRIPFLYVGTNDGVLHSFNIDEINAGTPKNVESWGYVPFSILDNVRYQFPILLDDLGGGNYNIDTDNQVDLYRHMFLLDGSPIARDVLMIRSDLAAIDPEVEKKYWRSVVFGGLGKEGGRGYYALDVTEAAKDESEEPWFRWEISPDDGLYGNNECDEDEDDDNCDQLDKIGYPISKPALAYLRYETGSDTYFNGAAAILPGGWKADSNPNTSNPKEDGNTGVYIVRLGDGHLIRYLDPGNEDDICQYTNAANNTFSIGLERETISGIDTLKEGAQLLGEPVVAGGSRTIDFATEAYIGDDRGRLWIVDFSDEDESKWCLSIYFDTLVSWHFPYQNCIDSSCVEEDLTDFPYDDRCVNPPTPGLCPSDNLYRNMKGPRVMIMGAPTIAMSADPVTQELNPVLVFGTGQYDGLTAWNRNRIFSISDKYVNGHHEAELNWWIGDLGEEKSKTAFPTVQGSEFPPTNQSWYTATQTSMADKHVTFTYANNNTAYPTYFYNPGEKLIGRPTVFDEVAYFTTFVPMEDAYSDKQDACEAGSSRIWALDFNADGAAHGTNTGEDPGNSPFGKFIAEEDGDTTMFVDYPGYLLSGTQVVRRPDCGLGCMVFELVAQRPVPLQSDQTAAAIPLAIVRKTISSGGGVGMAQVRFDSWSIVFQ
ncbi:MAG: hypothetical protein GY762_10155 [Proteobacteria bacterium]|nr:hypothetical protein [Pseudomonadota bacterium]